MTMLEVIVVHGLVEQEPEAIEKALKTVRSSESIQVRDRKYSDHQLSTHEPLQQSEMASVFTYDASCEQSDVRRLQSWTPLLQRLLSPEN